MSNIGRKVGWASSVTRIYFNEVILGYYTSHCDKFYVMKADHGEDDSTKNIFTSCAASGVLTNDLVKIMQHEKVGLCYVIPPLSLQ